MTTPARFFGYGSLVNVATHSYGGVEPAEVGGWRRQWVQSKARPVSFLSVVPDPLSRIEGIIAEVGEIGWDGLDEREAAYSRTPLPEPHSGVQIYQAAPEHLAPPNFGQPILMSYLDVVVQGFNALYGDDGVRRFFRSTTGWETGILNDRAAPIYPRSLPMTAADTARTDAFLEDVATTVLERT